MEEELGIIAPLELMVKLPASAETAYEHTVLYRAVSDAVPVPHPEEIAEARFVPWSEVVELLRTNAEKFSPPFRLLVEWYDQRFAVR